MLFLKFGGINKPLWQPYKSIWEHIFRDSIGTHFYIAGILRLAWRVNWFSGSVHSILHLQTTNGREYDLFYNSWGSVRRLVKHKNFFFIASLPFSSPSFGLLPSFDLPLYTDTHRRFSMNLTRYLNESSFSFGVNLFSTSWTSWRIMALMDRISK